MSTGHGLVVEKVAIGEMRHIMQTNTGDLDDARLRAMTDAVDFGAKVIGDDKLGH